MVKRIYIYVYAFLVVLFFLVVANPFEYYFLNDDFAHIPLAASGDFLHTNLLRPIADLSLWIDSFIWFKNPAGFHLTNIFIHFANSFLLYLFVKRWSSPNESGIEYKALFTGLLFLIYAFHSESVFWIIGRGGSLTTFFLLLSLNCYTFSNSYLSLFASLGFFVAGLFTYESIWMLPAIFAAIQSFEYFQGKSPRWSWTISFIIVFVIYLVFRLNNDRVNLGSYELGLVQSFNVKRLMYNYFATGLRCFLPPAKDTSFFIIASGCFVLLISGLLVFSIKTSILRYLVVPAICIILSCFPSVSLGIDIHDTEGERFLYLPSVFCCWLIGEVIWKVSGQVKYSVLIISSVIIAHGFFFYRSADSYRYAGLVARSYIDGLRNVSPVDTLTAVNLPSQYKGALIFRKGFPQAVNWLMPGKFNAIKVLQTSEVFDQNDISCNSSVQETSNTTVFVEWEKSGVINIY